MGRLIPVGVNLWKPAAPPGAGAHVLIIGISAYPFLKNGSAPQRAPINGNLDQLVVSALTAARFFDWINTTAEVAGAPVADCRLLLAPQPAEKAEVDAITGGHYGAADFASVYAAVDDWANDIYGVSGDQSANVALFF